MFGRQLRSCVLLLATGLSVGCALTLDAESLSEGCGSEEKACDGQCVPNDDIDLGCASSQCQPCFFPHALALCDSTTGECAQAQCIGDFVDVYDEDDCPDGQNCAGCETDTSFDVRHCGVDLEICSEVPNATPGCLSGQCGISRCEVGYLDCDRIAGNGCEVNRSDDPAHCGECDVSCELGGRCVEGACEFSSTDAGIVDSGVGGDRGSGGAGDVD